jgi:hypothetical protein
MADQIPSVYRHTGLYANNTYKALRLMDNNSSSLFYSTWCTGEHEFYDMSTDAQQMNNWLGPDPKGNASEYYGRPQSELIARLDALLMVTKSCKQDTCRDPWRVLFPKGQVSNILDAMNPSYDTFFANQVRHLLVARSQNQVLTLGTAQGIIQRLSQRTHYCRRGSDECECVRRLGIMMN